MKNNKGFTLIELIITIGLLSLLSFAVLFMITAAANHFSRVQTNINLQMDSQIVMAQMQEQIANCNGGIVLDSSTDNSLTRLRIVNLLYVDLDRVPDEHSVQSYSFLSNDNEVRYDYQADALSAVINPDISTVVTTDLLTRSVADISYDFEINLATNRVEYVTIDYLFADGKVTYEVEQVIAMRNKPLLMSDYDSLMLALNPTPAGP